MKTLHDFKKKGKIPFKYIVSLSVDKMFLVLLSLLKLWELFEAIINELNQKDMKRLNANCKGLTLIIHYNLYSQSWTWVKPKVSKP